MSGYDKLNDHEKGYVREHPFNAYQIRQNRGKAFRETERRFGMNGRNDESDAFRHCYWSALISRDLGRHEAIKFTTLHEMRPGNALAEKSMDLRNNAVGAEIGKKGLTDEELSEKCYEALETGLLETVHDLFMRIRMNASWSMPRLESMSRSQFFQSRRHFSIHANERSTTQRFGITLNVWSRFRFATSTVAPMRSRVAA